MKRYLCLLFIAGICYLALSFMFGVYAEIRFRGNLASDFRDLGKDYFRDTAQLTIDLKGDARLHRDWFILKLTPPVGWIVIHRLVHVEDSIIFASRNYALPEAQRFSDMDQCKRFGFDPSKRSDDEISDAVISHICGFF